MTITSNTDYAGAVARLSARLAEAIPGMPDGTALYHYQSLPYRAFRDLGFPTPALCVYTTVRPRDVTANGDISDGGQIDNTVGFAMTFHRDNAQEACESRDRVLGLVVTAIGDDDARVWEIWVDASPDPRYWATGFSVRVPIP